MTDKVSPDCEEVCKWELWSYRSEHCVDTIFGKEYDVISFYKPSCRTSESDRFPRDYFFNERDKFDKRCPKCNRVIDL